MDSKKIHGICQAQNFEYSENFELFSLFFLFFLTGSVCFVNNQKSLKF